MNRTARIALIVPLSAFFAAGGSMLACRGGGTLDGLDGSFDGQAAVLSMKGELCEQAVVTIEDDGAGDAATNASGCAKDDECTVRIAGDYCACPSTPRPMLASRAAAFDQSLDGITKKCTCQISPCEPLRPSRAVCRENKCALAE
jgi:hypothetical protein